jgi:predicted nucleic acid-binding protein
MPESFILDTNVFNRLADGKIQLADISRDGKWFATMVQLDELSASKKDERRRQLVAEFYAVDPDVLATETFCFDISRMDIDKWGDGKLHGRLKACLDAKDEKRSNTRDALIAEVAIVRKFTLVTADRDLADTAEEHGAKVLRIN